MTVTSDLTLGRFMDDVVWRGGRHTTYPVVDDGEAVGLLPFRCVAGIPRSEWDRRRVRDCMLPKTEVPIFSEDEDAADALARLSETGAGRGLVVSNGRLEGIVSMSDLARAHEARRRGGRRLAEPASP